MTLTPGSYAYQFTQFCWTHMTLLLVVFQAHFIVNSIFEGLIWFFLPVCLVVTNDIFAYICGMLWGRTPLIRLSPKKTVEGFIGGWICTIVIGGGIAYSLSQFKYMICPVTVPLPSDAKLTIGSRGFSMVRFRLHTKSSLCSPGIHSSPLPDPLVRQTLPNTRLCHCRTYTIPHPCSRNIRISHCSVRRILRKRSKTSFPNQRFRGQYPRTWRYDRQNGLSVYYGTHLLICVAHDRGSSVICIIRVLLLLDMLLWAHFYKQR
jgi:hypothetical protein